MTSEFRHHPTFKNLFRDISTSNPLDLRWFEQVHAAVSSSSHAVNPKARILPLRVIPFKTTTKEVKSLFELLGLLFPGFGISFKAGALTVALSCGGVKVQTRRDILLGTSSVDVTGSSVGGEEYREAGDSRVIGTRVAVT